MSSFLVRFEDVNVCEIHMWQNLFQVIADMSGEKTSTQRNTQYKQVQEDNGEASTAMCHVCREYNSDYLL